MDQKLKDLIAFAANRRDAESAFIRILKWTMLSRPDLAVDIERYLYPDVVKNPATAKRLAWSAAAGVRTTLLYVPPMGDAIIGFKSWPSNRERRFHLTPEAEAIFGDPKEPWYSGQIWPASRRVVEGVLRNSQHVLGSESGRLPPLNHPDHLFSPVWDLHVRLSRELGIFGDGLNDDDLNAQIEDFIIQQTLNVAVPYSQAVNSVLDHAFERGVAVDSIADLQRILLHPLNRAVLITLATYSGAKVHGLLGFSDGIGEAYRRRNGVGPEKIGLRVIEWQGSIPILGVIGMERPHPDPRRCPAIHPVDVGELPKLMPQREEFITAAKARETLLEALGFPVTAGGPIDEIEALCITYVLQGLPLSVPGMNSQESIFGTLSRLKISISPSGRLGSDRKLPDSRELILMALQRNKYVRGRSGVAAIAGIGGLARFYPDQLGDIEVQRALLDELAESGLVERISRNGVITFGLTERGERRVRKYQWPEWFTFGRDSRISHQLHLSERELLWAFERVTSAENREFDFPKEAVSQFSAPQVQLPRETVSGSSVPITSLSSPSGCTLAAALYQLGVPFGLHVPAAEELCRSLVEAGRLTMEQADEYPVFRLTRNGRELLKAGQSDNTVETIALVDAEPRTNSESGEFGLTLDRGDLLK